MSSTAMFSKILLVFLFASNLVTLKNAFEDHRSGIALHRATQVCRNNAKHTNYTDTNCCNLSLASKQAAMCCIYSVAYSPDANTKCCTNHKFKDCFAVLKQLTSGTCKQNVTLQMLLTRLEYEDSLCGEKIFNRSKEICCKDVVYNNLDGNLDKCCGDTAYNSITHVCCGSNNVIVKADPQHDKCCNNITYSSSFSICEDGVITEYVHVCNGHEINPHTHVCCEDLGKPVLKRNIHHNYCCNGISYSREDGHCCCRSFNGVKKCKLYELAPGEHFYCCMTKSMVAINKNPSIGNGTETYDRQTQTCCEDVVGTYDIHEGTDGLCCGTKKLDRATEECCGADVIPKSAGDGVSDCCNIPLM